MKSKKTKTKKLDFIEAKPNPVTEYLRAAELRQSTWAAVEVDKTLFIHPLTNDPNNVLGVPNSKAVDLVRNLLADGHRVKLLTHRILPIVDVSMDGSYIHIPMGIGLTGAKLVVQTLRKRCIEMFGTHLEITAVLDERCVMIASNRSVVVGTDGPKEGPSEAEQLKDVG